MKPDHQHGASHLLSVLILLAASTVLIFTVVHTGLTEQKMSANAYQYRTLRLAAEAGLEYGIAWLGRNLPDWGKATDPRGWQTTPLPGQASTPPMPFGDHYTLDIRLYRRNPYSPYLAIHSTAVSIDGPDISLSVEQFAAPNGGPIHEGLDLPPLVIAGCLGASPGGVPVYPRDWNSPRPTGPAVHTRSSPETGCIDGENLLTHGGSIQYQAFQGNVWDYVFRKSRDEIHTLAAQETEAQVPVAARTYIWETGATEYRHSRGSPSHPVVLVFTAAAGCPEFLGSIVVYGIVYIDGGCEDAAGLGALEVYGSVVIAGDVSSIQPGTALYHFSEVSGGPLRYPPDGIATVPGTWRDF